MQIDRVLYPIESLGPGNRLVIWTVGCSKHCVNCSNQELWQKDDSRDVPIDDLCTLIEREIATHKIEGITITGGDPFEQHTELIILLKRLRLISDDILVYTGYTIDELEQTFTQEEKTTLFGLISVLIEGRYIKELNDNKSSLIGSTNQKVIYLDPAMQKKYLSYLDEGRKIQNVFYINRVISVGIHNRES